MTNWRCDVCKRFLPHHRPDRLVWGYHSPGTDLHSNIKSVAVGLYCSFRCSIRDTDAAKDQRLRRSEELQGKEDSLGSVWKAGPKYWHVL